MKTLVIDTSLTTATVAIGENEKVICCKSLNSKNKHSKTLLPLIKKMLDESKIKPKEIEHVVCGIGPGSFTGIRIGIATAKGVAYSNNTKVTYVTSLEGLALNLKGSKKIIIPIIDAKRRNVFTAMFKFDGNYLKRLMANKFMTIEKIIEIGKERDEEVIFIGDCLEMYKEELYGFEVGKDEDNIICSSKVYGYAQKQLKNNIIKSKDLKPMYLIKSQAEREFIKKNIDKVKLRQMVAEDIEEIFAIEVEAFVTPWSKKNFKDEIESDKSVYFVAKFGNELVGYIGSWYVGDESHITNIAVKEEYKRFGIGSKLLERQIEYGNENGIRHITLEVMIKNDVAINLYKKYGFKIEGERKNYCRDTGENAYIMWKRG